MNIDNAGVSLIKGFEGLVLHAYKDKAGVWTIGYGCTYYIGGKHVQPGDKLADEAAADAMLRNVLATYVQGVNRLVKVPLTQNQFNALVSFTYNLGIGALAQSTALTLLNEHNYTAAADHLLLWDKITDSATGQKVVLDDLVLRRRKERAIFLTK